MNILEASFKYFRDILKENCGVKALITDEPTLTVMSLAMTRTELLSNDVIATEEIRELCQKPCNEIALSLKCVVILKPTRHNIELLSNELSTSPHFSRYSIYFTNNVIESQLRLLAKFDKFGLVDRVEEVYLDYYPLNSRLFSLNLPDVRELRSGHADLLVSRIADGIFASLCALRLRPVVRYGANSPACRDIAKAVADRTAMAGYTQPNENACLLVLDRSCDPIAALIRPWFYIGAIHDMFTIKNNIVAVPGSKDRIVIDERHDTFLQEHGCGFLADIGPAVAERMAQAKRLNEAAKQTIRTPDQIADVVSAATQFQEQFSVLGNHMALTSAINDCVNAHNLINVGEVEQGIATSEDPVRHCEEILRLSEDPTVPSDAIQRLLLLFALRYENRAEEQMERLRQTFPQHAHAMDSVVENFGVAKRGSDDVVTGRATLTQLFTNIRALCDAQPNALDQYQCLLASIIDRLKKGTLSTGQYPFAGAHRTETARPRLLIVFYVGGATYAEMRTANSASDIDVIVGGTFVHNASSFIRNGLDG